MTPPLPHIAVVMACFNRRAKTLSCLRSVFGQGESGATIKVHLVDDGSTDGTGEAVRSEFPQVTVIAGSGDLFWGGGMCLAMGEAVKAPYDFVLWLNDDVTLETTAIADLLRAYGRSVREGGPPAIIVGAVTDPATGRVSYAGFNRRNWWHPAQVTAVGPEPGRLVPCNAMNGNCVLIPRQIVEAIGLVDGKLIHGYGDIDYGYRARRAGFNLFVAPASVGTCPPNPASSRARLAGRSSVERWRLLTAPRATPLRPMFRFLWRHGGVLGAMMGGWTLVKLASTALRPW